MGRFASLLSEEYIMTKEKKTDVVKHVRVIRYLRNLTQNYEPSNLGGVTLVFDMDYEDRTVAVRFSICSEKENFNKALGLETAINSGVERILPLDPFRKLADIKGGFLDAYYAMIETDQVQGAISEREKLFLKKVDAHKFNEMRDFK
jgi:hypothetical protein